MATNYLENIIPMGSGLSGITPMSNTTPKTVSSGKKTNIKYVQDPNNPNASIPEVVQPLSNLLGGGIYTNKTTTKTNNTNTNNTNNVAQTADGTKITPASNLDVSSIEQPVDNTQNNLTVANSVATTSATQKLIEEEQKRVEEEKQKAEELISLKLGGTGDTTQEKLLSAVENAPKSQYQSTLAAQQEKYRIQEINDKVAEQNIKVAEIKGEITKIDTQEQVEIDNLEQSGVTRGAIDREKAVIQRKYASQRTIMTANLAAEAALAAAYSGNLTNAQTLVNQAVDAYTADYSYEVKKFENMFTVASSWINQLDEESRSVLTKSYEEAKAEEAKIKTDKTNVLNLMVSNPQAGITINDTPETAAQKVAKNPQGQLVGSAAEGYQRYNPATNTLTPVEGGGTGSLLVQMPDGATIDLGSISGLQTMAKTMKRSEIESYLDTNSKLTATSIKNLLNEAGILPDAEKEIIDNLFAGTAKEKGSIGGYTESELIDLSKELGISLGTRQGGFAGWNPNVQSYDPEALKSYFEDEYARYRASGMTATSALAEIKNSIKAILEK